MALVFVTVFYHIPVNDVPELFKGVGTSVLIVEIVCVFPNIKAEQRTQSGSDRTLGIFSLSYENLAVFVARQPYPAAAEQACTGVFESLFELFE